MSEASPVSLLHMLQTFLIDTQTQIREALPGEVEVSTAGRTITRGTWGGTAFGVRVRMSQFDDDMWPHIDAILEIGGEETVKDLHPDLTTQKHAVEIVATLAKALGHAES